MKGMFIIAQDTFVEFYIELLTKTWAFFWFDNV